MTDVKGQSFNEISRWEWVLTGDNPSSEAQDRALIIGCLQRAATALETISHDLQAIGSLARRKIRRELDKEEAQDAAESLAYTNTYGPDLAAIKKAMSSYGAYSRIRDGLRYTTWMPAARKAVLFPPGNWRAWPIDRLDGVGKATAKAFAEAAAKSD